MSESKRRYALGIVGGAGKLASATLKAIFEYKLLSPSDIVATTSATSESSEQWQKLKNFGVTISHATFDDPSSIKHALQDVDKVFIVSSARISMDFFDAPSGQGREKDHIIAINAAREAGVKHIYYTSLAYGRPTKAPVMRAHVRTEEYLEQNVKDVPWTIIREGLYNETWPLYLGHWKLGQEERSDFTVVADGKISWTSIADLGLANALVLAAPSDEYAGKTFYLSNTRDIFSLEEVAGMISRHTGRTVRPKTASTTDYNSYYIQDMGMDRGFIEWTAGNYDAFAAGECEISDGTFDRLLASKGVKPKPMEETVKDMLGQNY